MSVKKMGSKLAQGVRQVMDQTKTSEAAEKIVGSKVTVPVAPEANVTKPAPAKVSNKTPVSSRDAEYEISHPDRVWPD